MTGPIMKRELVRARGRQAFKDGKGRDAHGMGLCPDAAFEWQAGWDEAALVAKSRAAALPRSHVNGVAVHGFDAHQVCP